MSVMKPSLARWLKIVAGCIGLACLLGICLDLVTAHVAVEYFSVHHPKIVDSENPRVLALVWGVAAAWWAGAIAGVVIATINHRRSEPLAPKRILKWGAIACAALWLVMMAVLAAVIAITTMIPLEERRPTFEHDRRLVAVAVTHQFEYLLAAIAMVIIAVMVIRAKPKPARPA